MGIVDKAGQKCDPSEESHTPADHRSTDRVENPILAAMAGRVVFVHLVVGELQALVAPFCRKSTSGE